MYVFWYGVCIFYMCTKVINLVALQQLHPRCCFGKGCYKVWVSKCWRRSIRRERASFLAYAFWVHKNATPKNWLMRVKGKLYQILVLHLSI